MAGGPGFGVAGEATSAQLIDPSGVAVDGLGSVYIANTLGNRIQRVDPSGTITNIAGIGTFGYSGDGGLATDATFDEPVAVTVDGVGNVYVADQDNHAIRRIDTFGIITTIAGLGPDGAEYDPADDGGPAVVAHLSSPRGVTLDAQGNLYIADTGNRRIRKIDASGIITTVAGNGNAAYRAADDGGPAIDAQTQASSVAVDDAGNLYIGDGNNERIRKIDTTGLITTFAGTGTLGFSGDGGPAANAQLAFPTGIAIDGGGSLLIADESNQRIRRIDASGVIATVAGNGTTGSIGDGGAATSAPLSQPTMRLDSHGNLYITDTTHSSGASIRPAMITTVAGDGTSGNGADGVAATASHLSFPTNVALDGNDNLFITDNVRIRRVDGVTGIITTVAGGTKFGDGGDGGPATDAKLGRPVGLALDAGGNPPSPIGRIDRIRRVDATTQIITTVAGTGVPGFQATDDGGPATSAELDGPSGVAFDAGGNLVIADSFNCRIRRVDAAGIITTIAGTTIAGFDCGYSGDGGPATAAQLEVPLGVAFDGAGLYVADNRNGVVRLIDATGTITTVAGGGAVAGIGAPGDGGPALAAPIVPQDVATDGSGRIYIGDLQRVRRVDAAGIITTVAGQVDLADGMGPLPQGHLADPRAVVVAAPFTLFPGGSSGTIQAVRTGATQVGVVAGRYNHTAATGNLARFRSASFGTVAGVAYDPAGFIYMVEDNRIDVITLVDASDEDTWTIAPLAGDLVVGSEDGPAASARFFSPAGLYLDGDQLYVADAGNHVIRAIDLSSGLANATVRTVIGTMATRGFFGDGGPAASALLFAPQAITRCANGDLFVADTGNNRVRRGLPPTARSRR